VLVGLSWRGPQLDRVKNLTVNRWKSGDCPKVNRSRSGAASCLVDLHRLALKKGKRGRKKKKKKKEK